MYGVGPGSSPTKVNILQPKITRNILELNKLGLLLQGGRALPMGSHECLSKRRLGRTYYRIWGGSGEALDWVLSESRGKSDWLS